MSTLQDRLWIFDDIDADLRSVKWSKSKRGRLVTTIDGRPLTAHRIIAQRMGIIGEVDHENRDPSDNRRHNIRPCTRSENNTNRGKLARPGTPTPYKGVYRNNDKWAASIQKNKIRTFLGYFGDDISAAKAYDVAARELHGAFALTNF